MAGGELIKRPLKTPRPYLMLLSISVCFRPLCLEGARTQAGRKLRNCSVVDVGSLKEAHVVDAFDHLQLRSGDRV